MQFAENKPTRRQKIIGVLLALLTGVIGPFTPVGPVAMTFLFAYAGMPAFIMSIAVQALVSNFTGGMMLTLVCLLCNVLPATLVVRGVRWRKPFHAQMKRSIIYQFIGVLISVLVLYTYMGGNIIGKFVDSYGMTLRLAEMKSEQVRSMVDSMLVRAYGAETMKPVLEDAMERTKYLKSFLNDFKELMTLSLPGMLITNGLISGILMVMLPNWYWRHRGLATEESYVTLEKWRLPGQIVLGLLALYATGLVIYFTDMNNGGAVFVALESMVNVCFSVQAASAIARQLTLFGIVEKKRNIFISVMVAALWIAGATPVLVWIGCASALFGSQGVITLALRRHREKNDKNE